MSAVWSLDRASVLERIGVYFDVRELVCSHVHGRFGESSWQFLDTDYLRVLLVLRDELFKSCMTCNTWHVGGSYGERGLRCNCCSLVRGKSRAYLSAHLLGKGGDFSVSGLSAGACRDVIKANSALFGCNVRVEGGVSWLHVDVLPQYGIFDRVYEFKV